VFVTEPSLVRRSPNYWLQSGKTLAEYGMFSSSCLPVVDYLLVAGDASMEVRRQKAAGGQWLQLAGWH
jgi:hypothetical protein